MNAIRREQKKNPIIGAAYGTKKTPGQIAQEKRDKQSRVVAGRLMDDYEVTDNKKAITEDIVDLYRRVDRANSIRFVDGQAKVGRKTYQAAKEIAERAAESVKYTDNSTKAEYTALREYVRNTPVKISTQDRSSIPDFNAYRRDNFGSVRISNKGISIDTFFNELSGQFPHLFNPQQTTNPADQLTAINEALSSLKPRKTGLSSEMKQQFISSMRDDIIREYIRMNAQKSYGNAAKTFSEMFKSKSDLLNESEKYTLFIGLKVTGVDDLAVDGGESPEDFHITLLYGYFEPRSDEDDLVCRVQSAIDEVRNSIPDKIHFDEVGRFPASESSDGKDVIYAQVAAGQLEKAHKDLVYALKKAGIKVEETFSEYKPHMTLAYIDQGTEYDRPFLDRTATITKILIGYGRNTEENRENTFAIQKTDEDKRLVFGWANIAVRANGEQINDLQNDIVDPEDLEEGVYEYVLNFRNAGEEHIPGLRKKARMVESVVFTKEKLAAMGIPEGTVPLGWWIGFYVDDDKTWEKIKNGTYQMFSIEGRGTRIPVDKSAYPVAKSFSDIVKFNPYHDKLGRFSSSGAASSFTYAPGKSKAHDLAIAREKQRTAAAGGSISLERPIEFKQGGQKVRITELTESDGEKSCKAQSRSIGQDWKDITDKRRLKGLRDTADAMKEYDGRSTESLKQELEQLKNKSNENYQMFTGAAASRSGSMVTQFSDADAKSRVINAVLDNRKYNSSSSGGGGSVKAIEIDTGNGVVLSYRTHQNGLVTDINGTSPKTTNNMSLDQLVSRAKQLGYKVKTYDDKQLNDYDQKRQKDREETRNFLNYIDVKDRSSTYRAPRTGYKGH